MENKFMKYDVEFKQLFKVSIMRFIDRILLAIGIQSFDVIGFDKYLHTIGYTEEKDGSVYDYIRKNYGCYEEGFLKKIVSL